MIMQSDDYQPNQGSQRCFCSHHHHHHLIISMVQKEKVPSVRNASHHSYLVSFYVRI